MKKWIVGAVGLLGVASLLYFSGGEAGGSALSGKPEILEKAGVSREDAAKIADIDLEARTARINVGADLKLARMELDRLMEEKTVDRGEVNKIIDRIGALHSEMLKGRAEKVVGTRAILGPEAEAKLREIRGERKGQHRGPHMSRHGRGGPQMEEHRRGGPQMEGAGRRGPQMARHGREGRMKMREGRMMGRGAAAGKWWEKERVQKELLLTPEQVEKLDSGSYDLARKRVKEKASLDVAELEFRHELSGDDANLKELNRKADEVGSLHAALLKNRMDQKLLVKGVLTPEQLEKAERIRRKARDMAGRHGRKERGRRMHEMRGSGRGFREGPGGGHPDRPFRRSGHGERADLPPRAAEEYAEPILPDDGPVALFGEEDFEEEVEPTVPEA